MAGQADGQTTSGATFYCDVYRSQGTSSAAAHHQRDGYDAIFDAGSQTIRILLANDKYLGTGNVGFFGALHTWGRDPATYHPHVHFVVPGGGVSRDGSRWLQTPKDFLFHHGRATRLYKKLFAREMKKSGLYSSMPCGVLKKKWVVDIKPVGNGQAVLKYLAPYVYRVAISDNRIEAIDEHGVSYRSRPVEPGNQFREMFRGMNLCGALYSTFCHVAFRRFVTTGS